MKKQQPATGRSSISGAAAKSTKSSFAAAPLIVFVVGAAVLVWLIISTLSPPARDLPPAATTDSRTSPPDPMSTNAAPTPAPGPDLSEAARQKLLGAWQRTDAAYQINIRNVRPDGGADAEYLNPRPIHVARSFVAEADGELGFFMELQDEGYPGSTYTLRYDATSDVLVGVYHQAAMQQDFDVSFARVRP